MAAQTPTPAAQAKESDALRDPDWAWAPYEPSDERPWDLPRAGHLFRRAGFGATWNELKQALDDGPQRTVDRLLRPNKDVDSFNRTYDEYDAAVAGSGSAEPLRAWWLQRMAHTPHPLLEKMTLFWHDYFAASAARVPSAALMLKHVQLLRSNALGRFPALLEGVSRDPAVLLALGADANRKAMLNESLARQFFDRFTLGPGNYSDEDVQEAARAFSGWFVLRLQLRYFEREHDEGAKRVLGRKGNFTDKDVVRIALEQPATARLVVRRLYRWLISETDEPTDALVAPLADSFANGYDVARLVERMLRSNLLFSAAAYRRRVKRPVEFALGIVRGLEGNVATTRLAGDLASLGENLYYPPTVKGWAGGQHWLNSATLVRRSNLALGLVAGSGPYGGKLDPTALAKKHGHADVESAGRFLVDLFLQGDLDAEVRATLRNTAPAGGNLTRRLRERTHLILTLPEFQLA